VLVLGTADWDQPIATNQHYVAREIAAEYDVTFSESMGLRRPEIAMRDIRRIWKRLRKPRGGGAVTRRARPSSLSVVVPMTIPVHTAATRAFNQAALHRTVAGWLSHEGPKVLWTYSPLTYGLEDHAEAVIYHCVDLLGEVPGIPSDLIESQERRLATRADAVIASSDVVRAHLSEVGFTDILLWGNVADTEPIFARSGSGIPREPNRAVFAGNLTTSKVDFDLLRSLVESGVDLHLAGPIGEGGGDAHAAVASLTALGATYHGHLDYESLADLYWSSSVGLIPYQINDYTRGVSPLKTFEYLAAGMAVVSTPVPSVAPRDEVVFVRPAGRSFVEAVQQSLGTPSEDDLTTRFDIARQNSWSVRGVAVRELIGEALMRTPS
jgi:teichuronic acid biosynthesis glycosyltransferase TuaH